MKFLVWIQVKQFSIFCDSKHLFANFDWPKQRTQNRWNEKFQSKLMYLFFSPHFSLWFRWFIYSFCCQWYWVNQWMKAANRMQSTKVHSIHCNWPTCYRPLSPIMNWHTIRWVSKMQKFRAIFSLQKNFHVLIISFYSLFFQL